MIYIAKFIEDDDGQYGNSEQDLKTVETEYSTWIYDNNELNGKIQRKICDDVPDFVAPWWYSPLMAMLPYQIKTDDIFVKETLYYENGACFAVDWLPYKPRVEDVTDTETIKVCLYAPGLGGDADKTMVRQYCGRLKDEGYYAAVVNQRGRRGVAFKHKGLWFPGCYDDIDYVLENLINSLENDVKSLEDDMKRVKKGQNKRKVRIFLAGTSAGTAAIKNSLLKRSYGESLGENLDAKILGGFAVCISYDYAMNREQMESTVTGRMLSGLFAKLLRDIFFEHPEFHKEYDDEIMEKIRISSRLSDFDAIASVNLYGFSSEEEYIKSVSNFDLCDMDFPYLVVQPADDPIYNGNIRGGIDVMSLVENPNIIYHEPKQGGHNTFYEGTLFGHLFNTQANVTSNMYPARVSGAFFEALLENDRAME